MPETMSPPAWAATRITIATNPAVGLAPATAVDAWATPTAPGLAVHASPLGWEGYECWTVAHVASGRSIARGLSAREVAQEALLAIAPLADWTRDGQTLGRNGALRAVVERALAGILDRDDAVWDARGLADEDEDEDEGWDEDDDV